MKWSVNAGLAARSETKSKTSSRGAEMVVETVTSRMRGPSYLPRSGSLRRPADDGQPPLAGMHALGAHSDAALLGQPGEAEVAQRATSVELMEALTRERGATALAACGCARRERSDAAPDEHGGEVWHGNVFESGPRSPPRPR